MKIVIVYQYYQSDNAPGHSLIYDWTQHLAECGHEIIVVSGETGYMKCDVSTLPWYKRVLRKEQIGLVKVIRTYTYSAYHRGYFKRLLGFLSFSLSCPLGLFSIKKPDLVIASSPPIFPIFSAWITCKLRRTPFIMEVRDLWPASAIEMGILKNKSLIKVMTWMEKVLYSQANKIIALTEGIKNNICERGWPKEKVALINCGVDISKLYPDDQGALMVRKQHHLENKKIILYFGALGEANNISVILQAAKNLKNHHDILFILVGDGMLRAEIKQQIDNLQLNNVLLLNPVPKEQARWYISAADLCVVTLLDIPLFKGALPTKLLDYMACSKPVLCGVQGEAKKLIDESNAGLTFEPNNDKQLSDAILKLLQDNEKALLMGINGIEFVKSQFTTSKMHTLIESIIAEYCALN